MLGVSGLGSLRLLSSGVCGQDRVREESPASLFSSSRGACALSGPCVSCLLRPDQEGSPPPWAHSILGVTDSAAFLRN